LKVKKTYEVQMPHQLNSYKCPETAWSSLVSFNHNTTIRACDRRTDGRNCHGYKALQH